MSDLSDPHNVEVPNPYFDHGLVQLTIFGSGSYSWWL